MKTKRRVLNKNKMQPRKSRKEMLKEARLTKNRRVGIGNIGKGKRFGFLNKRNLKKARKVAIVSAGVFGVFLLIGTVYAFSYLQSLNDELPTTEQVFPQVPIASEIYDRKALEGDGSSGTMLYRLINQDYNSDPVDIDEIPDYVKFAFIAAEDENFYGHNGFDAIAIARCAVYYVQDSNNLCGGSTITQQLVKITSLTNEVKLERKLKELILATKVEQANSKDEILQMYLQVAPFGSNVYGINTASNFYFRKDPKDLTLAEAAILASIVQNPTYLSPTKGIPDLETAQAAVKNRQMFVLGQLEENMERFNDQIRDNHDDQDMPDVLTKELIDEAKVQELSYASPVLSADIKAGHFVDYVVSQLTTRNYKYGEQPFTEEELRNGGYKIYTSLDYELQQIAERYAEVGGNSYKYLNVHNAAIMTTVPSTGEIITMAGSKSFTGDDEGCDANLQNCRYNPQVNVLTSLQSPGSTNKPLGYYLAFKSGKIFPGSMLPDVPIQIGGYVPKNWNSGFSGLKTNASEALRQSLNIPALHAIQLVGVDTYVNTAREWGYTSYGDDLGPSVILGGGSVYMTEHVQGYGVFANGGDLVKLDPIKKIVDKDGEVVYEAKPERKQVGDPQAIYQLTQSLKSYGQGVSFDGREWAGKTGTTENNEDTLYMIYTPDMVTVGWAGNNNRDLLDQARGYPVFAVSPWLDPYLREIGNAPYFSARTSFDANRPGFLYQGGGSCNSKGECVGLTTGWMVQGREPAPERLKKKVTVCTDQKDRLARDIDKALGYAEEVEITVYKNPVAEWQRFVDEYLKGNNKFPTENCTIDRSGGTTGPVFVMSSPSNGASVELNAINVKGSVASTVGTITNVDVTLGGVSIGSITSNFTNFDLNFDASSSGVGSGTKTLTLTATDSQGYTNSYSVNVVVGGSVSFTTLPPSPLQWGVNVGGAFTHTITLGYSGSGNLNSVSLQVYKNGVLNETLSMSGSGSSYSATWGAGVNNESATYSFRATASKGSLNFDTGIQGSVVVNPL